MVSLQKEQLFSGAICWPMTKAHLILFSLTVAVEEPTLYSLKTKKEVAKKYFVDSDIQSAAKRRNHPLSIFLPD